MAEQLVGEASFIFFVVSSLIALALYISYLLLRHQVLLIGATVFLWYIISISFTAYNKWIMLNYIGGFDFPLTVTFIHVLVKFIFSQSWKQWRNDIACLEKLRTPGLVIVCLIGLTTGLDIALSNESVTRLTITLYTIIKSTVIGFAFCWGAFLGIETSTWYKACSVLLIMSGLALSVESSHLRGSSLGVILCVSAAGLAGLRWSLMQLLTKHDSSSKDAFVSLYRFSPYALLAVAPLAIILESSGIYNSQFAREANITEWVTLLGLTTFGGIISCVLILVEVTLLNLTSSLTFCVFGQLKEVLQLLVAMIAFRDKLQLGALLGVAVTMSGAELFRHVKRWEDEATAGAGADGVKRARRRHAMLINDVVEEELQLCIPKIDNDGTGDGDEEVQVQLKQEIIVSKPGRPSLV